MEKYIKPQKDDFPVLIGLHESEAFRVLAQHKKHGISFRLFFRNGQQFPAPVERHPMRYNLIIVNSIVDSYFFK
jgi:hypothetical protein